MNTILSYDDLVSRNHLYITNDLQNKIKKTKISFFGTGLSSSIAESCARVGFMHFNIQDGDKVEPSNLNRQAFNCNDIGVYKAEALKESILKINSLCDVSINKNYINNVNSVIEQIESSDIIVNTIDCNETYFEVIEYARLKNKLVICPFNPGFAGLIICFTHDSCSAYDVFDVTKNINDVEVARQLFTKFPQIKTLTQADASMDHFLLTSANKYFPQIAVGALLTAGITLTTIIKYLNEDPIIKAPDIFYLNSY